MSLILKWLQAAGVGGLVAGLYAFLAGLAVVPAGIDPLVAGIVVAGLTKLVGYLVGKIQPAA